MLGHWRVDSRGPFLIRLRLNRVSHSSMKGTLLVLDILRAFIRVTHQLVVSAVVRLSPRALLPAVGVEHRPFSSTIFLLHIEMMAVRLSWR